MKCNWIASIAKFAVLIGVLTAPASGQETEREEGAPLKEATPTDAADLSESAWGVPPSHAPLPLHLYPESTSSADWVSDRAYDAVGSHVPGYPKPERRPLYPYGATEYWEGQDADVEEWGDLLELPHVRPGLYGTVEASVFTPKLTSAFNSGTLLDGTFPGTPVTIGAADLDRFIRPKFTLGYRFEHGLGEIQFSYQTIGTSGRGQIDGFDPFGPADQFTEFQAQVFDLDFCFQEFNAEGIPLIWPGFLMPGRLGLGRALTTEWLPTPLEIRWTAGIRAANTNYFSSASGPTRTDQVSNVTRGGGIHFAVELNQRLMAERNLFIHARAEGSGVFSDVRQRFRRSQSAAPGDPAIVANEGTDGSLAIPTVDLELGVSWVPSWPDRRWRWTLAYHFEEWFRFGDIDNSDANLTLGGVLMRGEWNF